ncbi:hypothetical protein [Allocoleopsis franciscana]|uniref:Uncharacterized protein n=1 Tax=Allocoleopsis franciscana PCC 7113 TaxID=1173027 RepID=K9W9M3_9CYAN|nr:hypothetical protein [Allocoleopsis franciscana]AFZ16521.1 hypothetical protein Mic7113_0607 [Allocoleopsis franciscana PCC 7113]
MHRLQFSATVLVSLPTVLGVGILTPILISPAVSQSIQIAQRPEFTMPDSGDNSTTPPTSEAPQTTSSPMPSTTPTSAPTPNPKPAQTATQNLTGDWVAVIIDNSGKPDFKHKNSLTQNGNQLQLVSGISGDTFTGTVSGQQVQIKFANGNNAGTISSDGNRIQFPDLLMVRLGSTGCQTYEACQIP